MNENCVPFIVDCHVRAGVELINHTWDPLVLTALRLGPTRRRVLLERLPGSSDKVLTESLRRLTSRGLVTRNAEYDSVDAAIYELTGIGSSFAFGPLQELARWVAENASELSESS